MFYLYGISIVAEIKFWISVMVKIFASGREIFDSNCDNVRTSRRQTSSIELF